MTATSGDQSTFGNAVDAIGFWGTSSTNPSNMQNNCVSVSLTRMLYYGTVGEMWNHICGGPLPDKPLSKDQIMRLVSSSGYNFMWSSMSISTSNSKGYRSLLQSLRRGTPNGPAIADIMLLLYVRKDGTGHCVNVVHAPSDAGWPPEITILDFQNDDEGESSGVAEDIKMNARAVILLHRGGFSGSTASREVSQREEFKRRDALEAAGRLHHALRFGRSWRHFQ